MHAQLFIKAAKLYQSSPYGYYVVCVLSSTLPKVIYIYIEYVFIKEHCTQWVITGLAFLSLQYQFHCCLTNNPKQNAFVVI